jgi:putative colanic acid biosynthesis acetyltransferase WcaF
MQTANPSLANPCALESGARVRPVQTTPFSLGRKLRMAFWGLVQATLFRWSPAPLRGFRRWLLRGFGAKLSATASVHNSTRIDCPWNLEMGERASVGEDAWVYALDKVVIGDETCVGQRVMLLTGSHDFSDPTFPLLTRPIVVGYGCWLAVGAIVLPGVKIGSLAVVGTGSVVTKDLPEQMVCAGNPCRPIKPRELSGVPRGYASGQASGRVESAA